jgi:hypothetical protein
VNCRISTETVKKLQFWNNNLEIRSFVRLKALTSRKRGGGYGNCTGNAGNGYGHDVRI